MSLSHLKKFVVEFNPVLDSYISESIQSINHPFLDRVVSQVLPLSEGGKRVRPYLCYLMSNTVNIKTYNGVYLSLELIHLFALIHDDIMDECDTRRGVETVHAKSKKMFENLPENKQNLVSNAFAILVGDLVFTYSQKAFVTSIDFFSSSEHYKKAYELFLSLKEEVIYGQLLDVYLSTQSESSEQEIYDKTFFKTASYTVIKPMQIGCILANREDLLGFCSDFGTQLGLGFQIQDDYFNLTLSEEQTGKPQYTDILENQKTVFSYFLQSHTDPKYHTNIQQFIGKHSISSQEKASIDELLSNSGALSYGKDLFLVHYAKAQQILLNNQDNLSKEMYLGLNELVTYLINRTS